MTAAAVVGHPGGPADALAAQLRELGLAVTACAPAGRDVLGEQLRSAAPELVVWAPAPGPAAAHRALVDLSPQEWDALAAEPLRQAIACFQAALDALTSGTIVAVLPTLAMNGAAGLTAWATASEGLRSLVKVTARELAPRAVTVNAVAAPAQLLAGAEGSLDRPGLPRPGCR